MTRNNCKICGRLGAIRADGVCWNCYFRDYSAWSRGEEEGISYTEAMIDKFKATIDRMTKDLTTMEDIRLNHKGISRTIPKITFLKKRYDISCHNRAP